MKPANNQQ